MLCCFYQTDRITPGALGLLWIVACFLGCTQSQSGDVSMPERRAIGGDAAKPGELPGAEEGAPTDQGPPDDQADASADAKAALLPAISNGYELYAWDEGDSLRFMLITGTSRLKTPDEIMVRDSAVENGGKIAISGMSFEQLERVLERVPAGTGVHLVVGRVELPPLSAESKAKIISALPDESP